ncbi:hypothetical protein [Archangium lipolyticum]|uniref:hypothetical protein n=1 Tax=Archangium lipolyticum TaxID=2970465 RepID=UPI00214A00DB|nr:hypothetical protein [Archangium lipolyticum]
MDREQFIRLQREKVITGQRQLANTLRALLLRTDPDIYEVLSEAPDDTFLEPLLFAWFSASKSQIGTSPIGLPQVVLGLVEPSLRPDAIEVYADAKGRVYLPRIGYFLTEVRERNLVLQWDAEAGRYLLTDGGAPVDFRFEPPIVLPGTSIELCRYTNPLYDLILTDATSGKVAVRVHEDVLPFQDSLQRALAILQEQKPDFYRELTATVKQVMLFHSEDLNSCAALAAHGVAFLNVKEGDDEVFFIDDLVHQCGHVIFNAVTVQRRDYLAKDPDMRLREVTGKATDTRSLYSIFHGVYTEAMMIDCLRACDERGLFSGKQRHELLGRLSFIFKKSQIDERNLSLEGFLTPKGEELFAVFRQIFEDARRERPDLMRYGMSNQAYNFSYERFAQLNPPEAPAASAA